MKSRIASLCLLLAAVMAFAACDDEAETEESGEEVVEENGDDSDDDPDGAAVEGLGKLGVVVETKSNDMITIKQSSDHHIEFCYDDGECEGESAALGDTANIGGEGNTMVLDTSDSERSAVGARVAFEVEEDGEAIVTIGTGTLHVDDEGVVPDENFEFDEVLETTDTLGDGDTVSIDVGEVD